MVPSCCPGCGERDTIAISAIAGVATFELRSPRPKAAQATGRCWLWDQGGSTDLRASTTGPGAHRPTPVAGLAVDSHTGHWWPRSAQFHVRAVPMDGASAVHSESSVMHVVRSCACQQS